MKRYIRLSTTIEKIDSKLMAPYKGYKVEKSWSVDSKGRVVKDSIRYAAIDNDDDWIGDMYKTVKEVHDYIDSIVKKGVKASSKLHIKNSSIGSTIKSARNAVKAAEFDAEAFKKRHRDAADRRKAKKEAAENADRIIFQIRESDKPIITAHDLLVPNTGKAETLAGELVRAMMRLLYRDYNDGDVFYEGYGIETCGSAVAFLCNKLPDLEYLFSNIAERNLKDDEYTNALHDIADEVLNVIYEDPSLAASKNDEDMFDYDGESFIRNRGWEPTYEAEIEIPQNVYAHIENGDISERDLEYEISTWDYCRDKEISVHGYYLTIYELGVDDYTEIDDNMHKWLEEYGNDLDDEYGVPDEEEDDEDYDGEEM